MPRNEDGTPQRFANPFDSWAQLQNDGGNTVPGRSNNCADCSRSFLESWFGNPQVSAPRTPDTDKDGKPDTWSPERASNENQIRWSGAKHSYAGEGKDPNTAARIANDLLKAGHGSAAIVQVNWPKPNGGGHAFNAVNYHGKIVWIDTQTGQVSHDPIHISKATHAFYIPLDANRQPLHADKAVAKPDSAPTNQAQPKSDALPSEQAESNSENSSTPHADSATDGATTSQADAAKDGSPGDPADTKHAATSDVPPVDKTSVDPDTPLTHQATSNPEHAPTDRQQSAAATGDRQSTPTNRGADLSQHLADALRHDQNPLIYGKGTPDAPDSPNAPSTTQDSPERHGANDAHVDHPSRTSDADADAPTVDASTAQDASRTPDHEADEHRAPEEPGSTQADEASDRSSIAERRSQAESLLGPTISRVVDLDSWVAFHEKKADAEFEQTIYEMHEARRLLDENPDHVLHAALELTAPTSTSNAALPEFDLGLSEPNGPIIRRVEVTTVESPIERPANIANAVAHGFKKVETREKAGFPLPRPLEVGIYLKVKAELKVTKGLTTERSADGTVKLSRPDGTVFRVRNLFDDITENLNGTHRASRLDRIVLSDPDMGVLAEYVNNGDSWERIR